MQWYYVKDGRQLGPVGESELLSLFREGEITPEDLVWNPTMGNRWAPASTVRELSLFPPALVPPSPNTSPGMTHNRDLIRMARESLRSHWGIAVGIFLLYGVIFMGAGQLPFIGFIANLIISGPLSVGLALVFLALARRSEASVGQLFDGFKPFGTSVAAYLLMSLFIFLWTLLLIIPGIIASYAYSMTFYVIADQPDIGPLEAIRRSKRMMRGSKWKLFCFFWRFFGWTLLCILTLGIGFIWLGPYMETAKAHFYDDVRLKMKA